MEKINHLYQILLENKDFNKYEDEQSTIKFEKYKKAFLEFIEIGSVKDLKLIMVSLDDWDNEGTLMENFVDGLIEFGKNDSKNFVRNFLQNLEVMYPYAKKGIEYVFIHILRMDIFKPYVYGTFITLNIEQKQVFKEIYDSLNKTEEDKKLFSILEIDEAIKSIA